MTRTPEPRGHFVPIEHPSGLRAELYYSGRDDGPPLLYLYLKDGTCLVRVEGGIEECFVDPPAKKEH